MALLQVKHSKNFEKKLCNKNPNLIYFIFLMCDKQVENILNECEILESNVNILINEYSTDDIPIICFYGGFNDHTIYNDCYHINGCIFKYNNGYQTPISNSNSQLDIYLKKYVSDIHDKKKIEKIISL